MNALVALLARDAGFKALYLSGASLSSSEFGRPDLGVITINDIVSAAAKIRLAVPDVPLIVDIDNGWNHGLLIERAGLELAMIGVYAAQIEDQAGIKQCGHLTIKELVGQQEMCRNIAILKNTGLKVLARTDALGLEGVEKTIERVQSYEKAGADFLFLEAVQHLEEIQSVKRAINIPLLVNLTEFGKTPMWNEDEMNSCGVNMLLYPMSVNRVVYKAAKDALGVIKNERSQSSILPKMMTRDELYQLIHYKNKEEML